jgi:YNFM family putative membrane transporter
VFGLNYARVGLLLGCMGLGGLLYALTVRQLVRRLGERGLALGGGVAIAIGFPAVALGSLWLIAPAIALLGLGLYMLHNTLQTNATQMAPEARGLAVSTFANVLFIGQAAGVWLSGLVIDRIGYLLVFIAAGAALLAVGGAFSLLLRHRPAST